MGDNETGGGEEEEKESENQTKPAARNHVTSAFGIWRNGEGLLSQMQFFNQTNQLLVAISMNYEVNPGENREQYGEHSYATTITVNSQDTLFYAITITSLASRVPLPLALFLRQFQQQLRFRPKSEFAS